MSGRYLNVEAIEATINDSSNPMVSVKLLADEIRALRVENYQLEAEVAMLRAEIENLRKPRCVCGRDLLIRNMCKVCDDDSLDYDQ